MASLFNAATVRYNFERAEPGPEITPTWEHRLIARVDVVDDYTVRLITNGPHPIVPERLTNFQMVPAAYAKEVGDTGLADKPVGTGLISSSHGLKDSKWYWRPTPTIGRGRRR
jgi:peptide/nickel transport system substrate-binding protein